MRQINIIDHSMRHFSPVLTPIAIAILITGCSTESSPVSAVEPGIHTDTATVASYDDNDSDTAVVSTPLVSDAQANDIQATDDQSLDAQTTGTETSDTVATDATTQITLSADNANAVILQAFEVLTGRAYDERITVFPYMETVIPDVIYTKDYDEQVNYASRSCENEGDVGQTIDDLNAEGNRALNMTNNSVYSDCEINSDVLNGRAELIVEQNCCDYTRTFSDNFNITFSPGGNVSVAGAYAYEPSTLGTQRLAVSDFNYDLNYEFGALAVSNANTVRVQEIAGTDEQGRRSYMNGSFTMSPPALNGASVTVNVEEDFVNFANSTPLSYELGRMRITADDSEIVVDADNGSMKTVQVTINATGGDSNSTTQDWAKWTSALAYVPPALSQETVRIAPNGDGNTITPDSYRAVLKEVFDIFTGSRVGPDVMNMPVYPTPDFPEGFISQSTLDGWGEPVDQICENGGTAQLIPYKQGSRDIASGWDSYFNDCIYNGQTFNGVFKPRNASQIIYRSPGISTTGTETKTSFSGLIDYKYQSDRSGSPFRNYTLEGVNFTSAGNGADIELHNANLYFSYRHPYDTIINGHFTFSSAATGNNTVSVVTADPLTNPYAVLDTDDLPRHEQPVVPGFTSGTVIVNAGNGNSLHLIVEDNVADTFTVYLYRAGAEPLEITEQWTDWSASLLFNFDLLSR